MKRFNVLTNLKIRMPIALGCQRLPPSPLTARKSRLHGTWQIHVVACLPDAVGENKYCVAHLSGRSSINGEGLPFREDIRLKAHEVQKFDRRNHVRCECSSYSHGMIR